MAGNYPSPTARRIYYGLNGTRSWTKTANQLSTALVEDSSFLGNMDDESSGTVPTVTLSWNPGANPGHPPFVLLKFPTPVDISGIKAWSGNNLIPAVSNDTTNGVDGTWTTGATVTAATGDQREWSRSATVTPQAFVNVRWLRLTLPMGDNGNRTVGKVILFGGPNGAADTLDFWDATLDQVASPAVFEFGDRPRGTSATREFRIKNRSATLTAKAISVTRSIVTDTSPSVPGFHTFSLDGTTWIGNLNIGDLLPGAISPVITLRQVVPVDAALWLWQMTVTATANTWET
ncbi:MAG: hypothetical protein M3R09_02450 [Actinomycetota bacterium]|nr:hypothetical protein [Actinomycetota bacterium]